MICCYAAVHQGLERGTLPDFFPLFRFSVYKVLHRYDGISGDSFNASACIPVQHLLAYLRSIDIKGLVAIFHAVSG